MCGLVFRPILSFNTQPPEGGWATALFKRLRYGVSTHSRLKAAGYLRLLLGVELHVSTHSRLKAAGPRI